MFIWDFVIEVVLGQFVDWVYAQVVAFLGDFFVLMGNMGAELFDMPWVQAITTFFSYFAWALYVTGLVVAGFEYAIEQQNGRGSLKDVGINAIKGFMAVGLFTTVPVELYKFCIDLQGSFSRGLTSLWQTGDGLSTIAIGALTSPVIGGLNGLVALFVIILMGYAVIKHPIRSDYVFSVCTCGGSSGHAMRLIGKALGRDLDCAYSIVMPNNYIIGMDIDSKEEAAQMLKAADERVLAIAEVISARHSGIHDVTEGAMAGLKTGLVSPLFNTFATSSKPFYTEDTCTGCKRCNVDSTHFRCS